MLAGQRRPAARTACGARTSWSARTRGPGRRRTSPRSPGSSDQHLVRPGDHVGRQDGVEPGISGSVWEVYDARARARALRDRLVGREEGDVVTDFVRCRPVHRPQQQLVHGCPEGGAGSQRGTGRGPMVGMGSSRQSVTTWASRLISSRRSTASSAVPGTSSSPPSGSRAVTTEPTPSQPAAVRSSRSRRSASRSTSTPRCRTAASPEVRQSRSTATPRRASSDRRPPIARVSSSGWAVTASTEAASARGVASSGAASAAARRARQAPRCTDGGVTGMVAGEGSVTRAASESGGARLLLNRTGACYPETGIADAGAVTGPALSPGPGPCCPSRRTASPGRTAGRGR